MSEHERKARADLELRDALFEWFAEHETDARRNMADGPEGIETLIDLTIGGCREMIRKWNVGAVEGSTGWLGQ